MSMTAGYLRSDGNRSSGATPRLANGLGSSIPAPSLQPRHVPPWPESGKEAVVSSVWRLPERMAAEKKLCTLPIVSLAHQVAIANGKNPQPGIVGILGAPNADSFHPTSRPDHCQDAGLERRGQPRPCVDDGPQLGVFGAVFCVKCAGFCAAFGHTPSFPRGKRRVFKSRPRQGDCAILGNLV